jgi:dTMP kinase
VVSRGCLIAFEGIDGSGKSTQMAKLDAWMASQRTDRTRLLLREPGGTELGEAIRGLLLEGGPWAPRAEMMLYMTARAELYAKRIAPAVEAGACVLVDRSTYSTAAYQGYGLDMDAEAILELGRQVSAGCWPDRVVLLRIEPEEAARRLSGGQADRIESRGLDYFRRVAEGYDAMAAAEPERFVVVDGSGDVDEVAGAVREGLADVL